MIDSKLGNEFHSSMFLGVSLFNEINLANSKLKPSFDSLFGLAGFMVHVTHIFQSFMQVFSGYENFPLFCVDSGFDKLRKMLAYGGWERLACNRCSRKVFGDEDDHCIQSPKPKLSKPKSEFGTID
ncbi:hypothetical protein C5167_050126 [Papaver somniferum]|uniref:Uncharacterized protein n=1 Tax=Papaver somniferum TaxID=3469 RepID=A0A4Y7KR65_PAPSO|nr:hypothetical protein C5167_050126 [Papaver somniferum]